MSMVIHTGSILHYLENGDPEYFENGALAIDLDKESIVLCGQKGDILKRYQDATIVQHDKLIMPGFIDTHVHYPQVDVMASYGHQLLDWLNQYTFPAESRFSRTEICTEVSHFFLKECFKNGTTSAMVFGTVHKDSVDEFFKACEDYNCRMICGKVMMDQLAPDSLCDTPTSSYEDSQTLIDTWHQHGRLAYAVTPRFAITSSPEQLAMAGKLLKENPSVYLQTHLSENKHEIEQVKKYHPSYEHYLDVYDHYGLLTHNSIFAHGIHLSDNELKRLSKAHSTIAFCPTSNLFLGSGLLDLNRLIAHDVSYSLATDVGAGTSLSMLQTLNEAYKVSQLTGFNLTAHAGFYNITLGNAKALNLDKKIGNFEAGKEADFIVIDSRATDLLTRKNQQAKNIDEVLFNLMMLGDERCIDQTYIAGRKVHEKPA